MSDKVHWADRAILRDFLWFLVLPEAFRVWLSRRPGEGERDA